jgi:cytochrome P450
MWNEPDEYRPERWLEPGAVFLPDVYDLAFGFGRR